jgi:hypothetical protein
MRLWVETALIGAVFLVAGLALLDLLPLGGVFWVSVLVSLGAAYALGWLLGVVMGWRLMFKQARDAGELPDILDWRGFMLLGVAFFVPLMFGLEVEFSENPALDLLIGIAIGVAAILLAMASAHTFGWTRPRRDGEWL